MDSKVETRGRRTTAHCGTVRMRSRARPLLQKKERGAWFAVSYIILVGVGNMSALGCGNNYILLLLLLLFLCVAKACDRHLYTPEHHWDGFASVVFVARVSHDILRRSDGIIMPFHSTRRLLSYLFELNQTDSNCFAWHSLSHQLRSRLSSGVPYHEIRDMAPIEVPCGALLHKKCIAALDVTSRHELSDKEFSSAYYPEHQKIQLRLHITAQTHVSLLNGERVSYIELAVDAKDVEELHSVTGLVGPINAQDQLLRMLQSHREAVYDPTGIL